MENGFEEHNRLGQMQYPDQWWEPEIWGERSVEIGNVTDLLDRTVLKEHQHCLSCQILKCDYKDCKVVTCPLLCGSMMHQCKLSDHVEELCLLAVVPCLNSDYGCPLEMQRRERGSHLATCPASVLVCNYMWNRWTTRRDRKGHQLQFFEAGQLDYELALRDQRMENELQRIPRKTKVQLRNFLTKRHPIVPVPSSSFRERDPHDRAAPDREYDMDEDNIDVNMKIYSKQQNKQIQHWNMDLTEKVGDTIGTSSMWELPELRKGGIHSHCSVCVISNCPLKDYFDPALWRESCQVVKCKWECGVQMHRCKTGEHRMICTAYKVLDEFAWIKRLEAPPEDEKLLDVAQSKTAILVDQTISLPSNLKVPRPPPIPRNLLQSHLYLSTQTEHIHRTIGPNSTAFVACLNASGGIKIGRKSMLVKPIFMRNFCCGKMYRRSEMSWHQINTHQQILPGITSGQLQKRCPLASSGCSFSINFRAPHSPGHQIIFSRLNDDFGCQPPVSESSTKTSKNNRRAPSLLGLPVEILLHIMRRLDAFSLRNISLTCQHLRCVVKNLLISRGCVNLKWERQVKRSNRGTKPAWNVTKLCWFFSSSMTPILSWYQEDASLMQKHLSLCHFYQPVVWSNGESEKFKSDVAAIHKELSNRVKLKKTFIYQ